MEIKCDIEKIEAICGNLDVQRSRYGEIVKKLYGITRDLESNGWSGQAASNYSKYIEGHKRDYDRLGLAFTSLSEALRKDVKELDYAIKNSKVRCDD